MKSTDKKVKIADFEWQHLADGTIPNTHDNTIQVKELLNSTGNGFCLAKFRQATIHIGTGLVHSCHHPAAHKIDPDEVVNNPSLLFNTPHLKNMRKQMLSGERPSECDFCWRVEDSDSTSKNLISDRHMKSSEHWALSDHDEIVEYTGDEDLYPSYLEVDFSNACNLRCTYCGPEFSSKWVDHLKNKGPIKIMEDTEHLQWVQGWQDLSSLVYKNRDYNPYVDAFWKWFPEAYKHLKHYRITGGEPLMSKETFRSFDWLLEHHNTELDFAINTNLQVPEKLWRKFIDKISEMRDAKCVGRITIFTSIEGWGERAEYGRTGLNFELFKERFEELAAMTDIRSVIMSTYNIFSITSFTQLLEWVLDLKKKHNKNNHIDFIEKDTGYTIPSDGKSFLERAETKLSSHSYSVGIDMPYLRHPSFLDARICSNDLVQDYWVESMNFIAAYTTSKPWSSHQGFEDHEYEKFYRSLVHRMYFNSPNKSIDDDHDLTVNRAKFYDFIMVKDNRDGTDFVTTFPEMESFLGLCEDAYNKIYGNHVQLITKA